MSSGYDVGQVCLNGHVITGFARLSPSRRQDFCDRCGEKTIMACPTRVCNTSIRGAYCVTGMPIIERWSAPGYCHKCGKPYPWTERRTAAAMEMVGLCDDLEEQDIEEIEDCLQEIAKDSRRAEPCVLRLKKKLPRMGPAAAAIRRFVLEFASKTVAEYMKGS